MEMNRGTFYCVGVGPGDPELITVKAVRTLEKCQVIAVPRTKGSDTLALEIARAAADLSGKLILPLDISMTRDEAKRAAEYDAAAAAVAEHLDRGEDVAMPNIGDVSIYATCIYVQDRLENAGYDSIMIPGVPSFCAVAARLGRTLTERDLPLHIIPGGGMDVEGELNQAGTKVLMKSGRQIKSVCDALKRTGQFDRAAMVANCGLPDERVFEDLSELPDDVGYFATIIVK